MKIEYIHLNLLEKEEQQTLKEIIELNIIKFQHILKDITSLRILIHTFDRKGSRKRISLEAIARSPLYTFHTHPVNHHHMAEWDIRQAVHKTINHLKNEMEHHIKKENKLGWIRKQH